LRRVDVAEWVDLVQGREGTLDGRVGAVDIILDGRANGIGGILNKSVELQKV